MKWLTGLYAPAIMLVLWQAIVQPSFDQKLLAIAIFLLSLDLLKMAIFDLEQVAKVRSMLESKAGSIDSNEPRLDRFFWVTIGTVVLELLGLYLAPISLSDSAIVILFSQVGFNLLTQVQLMPEMPEMVDKIQPWRIRDRAVVLTADGLGIGLVVLGQRGYWPIGTSIGLLLMVVIYGVIKYGQMYRDRSANLMD
jgi:hypothetical protein